MAILNIKAREEKISGNTEFKLSLKQLALMVGGILILFTLVFMLAYSDLKSNLEENRLLMEKDKMETLEEIEILVDRLRGKDDEFLRDIGDIKGSIKAILDRTNSQNNSSGRKKPFQNIEPPA